MAHRLTGILGQGFELVLADVGSAGGIHRRWRPFRAHIVPLLFDPFDTGGGSPRDRIFPYALGAAKGSGTLHVTRRVSMTSLLEPNAELLRDVWFKPGHTAVTQTLGVEIEALDTLVAAEALRVDVAKIDTQGYESLIIAGARRTLADQVMLCEVEVSFFERYRGLLPIDRVIGDMRELGFELIELSRIKRYFARNASAVVKPGTGLGNRPGRIAFADALFMKRRDALDALVETRHGAGDKHAALRPIIALAAYGKLDIAAALVDRHWQTFDAPTQRGLQRWLRTIARWQGVTKLPHLLFDYLARRV